MADRTMTLTVPQATYDQLHQRAMEHEQTVEDEARQAVERALAGASAMTDGATPTLAALALLSSDHLRRIAEREPAAESVLLLRGLREKREASGLSEAEEMLVRELVQSYDRAVLIRSRALLVLHQRGEDIADLLGQA
jgi:hypothetical protein